MRKHIKKKSSYKWVVAVAVWTFFLSIIISLAARLLMGFLDSLLLSFIILLLIILAGIIFDIIGVAAAAANEAPFHAKAARKVFAAKEAIFFVRNADMVSNFSSDVIGDISGIISGTIGALLVFRLSQIYPAVNPLFLGIALTAAIASLTVGGKAWGKSLAINRSTEVILLVSQIITSLKGILK